MSAGESFFVNEQEYAAQQQRQQRILDSYRKHDGNPLLILIGMYKDNYLRLFISAIFYICKHSPVWVMPVVTANVINEITNRNDGSVRLIVTNMLIMAVFLLQNTLTNYIHVRCYSKAVRSVEMGLRGALMRKLQSLPPEYYEKTTTGRLQSKIMRDVEAVQTFSEQCFNNLLSIGVNLIVAFTITATRSLPVLLFFVVTIPIAGMLITIFRGKIQGRNSEFHFHVEETSAKAMDLISRVADIVASGTKKTEIGHFDKQLKRVAKAGYRMDLTQSWFSSTSWIMFQFFQLLCLAFTSYLAWGGKIMVGDVVLYQSYYSSVVAQVGSVIGLLPILARGIQSIHSIGKILLEGED